MGIKEISNFITNQINSVRKAATKLPALLILCSALKRPGMSSMVTTANIIQRLPEAGISNLVNADGTPNVTAQLIRLIVEEIFKEFRNNAIVETVIPPFAGKMVGTITTPAGACAAQFTNIEPIKALGFNH